MVGFASRQPPQDDNLIRAELQIPVDSDGDGKVVGFAALNPTRPALGDSACLLEPLFLGNEVWIVR